jgi:hypothetical protein
LGNDGGEEAVTVDSHEDAAPMSTARSQLTNHPIRATVLTKLTGKKKHAERAACFSKSILAKRVTAF